MVRVGYFGCAMAAAYAATSSAPRNSLCIAELLLAGFSSDGNSALVVLVVAAPPHARLVAPLGGAVEPLVHAPEAVQSARISGISVVDDAVLEHEGAHARPLAHERGRVGSGHGRDLRHGPLGGGFRLGVQRVATALVVVF